MGEEKSAYERKIWQKSYTPGVPPEIDIPVKSLGKAFDEAALGWKDKDAIIYYGRKIKYGELKKLVDRFATALTDLGIKKGDRVGVLLLNSPDHIIVFYALVKLGAIISAVSPVYVSSEIKQQLEDCGAKTVICQDILYNNIENTGLDFENVILVNISGFLPKIKKALGKSVLRGVYQKMAIPSVKIFQKEGFYQFQDLLKQYPPSPPNVEIDPKEDIAMLPYTSGTTGDPKGVMLTHYNIIADDALYYANYPIFKDGQEFLIGYMPFYHASGCIGSMVIGLAHGQTLVVVTSPDLDTILYYLSKYKISSFLGAPAMYEMLKDYDRTNRVNWKEIKAVQSGADILKEPTAKDFMERTGVTIHDMYGMTETVFMTHATPYRKHKLGSIGIPLPNTMAALLDPDKDEFVPQGETGELVVNGPQVTKGYWGNPEATKDCESSINGIRWWRTGDLARMDEDGYFFIYDRKRDLIKYKGLRVYAREVEEILRTHPKIKEVGVIGEPDIKVGSNVKAMIVLESDARGKLSEEEIIEYCQGKLTHYKIPKIVEFLGEIPKTDVGKVSRRELRERGD